MKITEAVAGIFILIILVYVLWAGFISSPDPALSTSGWFVLVAIAVGIVLGIANRIRR